MQGDRAQAAPTLTTAATLQALELEVVLELLSSWAVTDVGAARLRSLRPASEESDLDQRRSEYLEVARALEQEGALVPSEEAPVASWLSAFRSAAQPLDGPALLQIARVLEAVARAGDLFEGAPDVFPAWNARLGALQQRVDATDPPPYASEVDAEASDGPADLAQAIRAVLNNKGEVRPDASPALHRLSARD